MRPRFWLENLLKSRFGSVILVATLLCSISLLTRIGLLINSAASFDWSVLNLVKVFFIGLIFDIAVASFATLPLVLYVWLLPSRWYKSRINTVLLMFYFYIVIATLIFNSISEWFFWEEFSVRYNFIAVDYLVYTTEVLGNIRQSYPINTIIKLLMLVTAGILYLLRKLINTSAAPIITFKKRSMLAMIFFGFALLSYFGVNHKWKYQSRNQFVDELAGNGMYDFGFAFWNNELDYNSFYKTLPLDRASSMMQSLLPGAAMNRSLKRTITADAAEQHLNVVLISVESLSAEFLGAFGNTQGITPQLDALAKKGFLFTQLYASGTRTVRGLEALSLCIPPTPGQSIVKRPDNKGLFTLGSVFGSKGYDSHFIYGGYGYFDNMNEFFSQNGYKVTDRSSLKDSEIHYSNIWGVADEDLFMLSLRELDKDYKAQKPFFAHIMTVSNHRPYTYPEGRIDIPSHTGREGAVKYTDYAIGKFIKEARLKPWFDNTLFVIVADHCASSAGKVELPVDKYHIPMILYSPKYVAPGTFDRLTAQIDIGPTLLGLLKFNYTSKFFGQDVFKLASGKERAFISTYQSLGYIKNEKLVILDPNKKSAVYKPDFKNGTAVDLPDDKVLIQESIANYQMASFLYQKHLYQFTK